MAEQRTQSEFSRALRLPAAAWGALAGLLLTLAAALVLAGFVAGEVRPAEGLLPADFFPEEHNERFSYRFAHPDAALLVPGSPPPGSVLTLHVASPAPLPARELVVAAFEQGELLRTTIGDEPRKLRLLLPPAGPGVTGVGLRLSSPAAEAPGDERRLGLLYTEMRVDGPAPPVDQVRIGLALLAPALLGGALLAVGLGTLAAGGAALLLALLAVLDPDRAAIYAIVLSTVLVVARLVAPGRLGALGGRARALRMSPAAWATATVVLLYSFWIGCYAVLNHSRFGTHTYDLGLYDQTFWLISRMQPNYSTGAGMNMLGSHAAVVLYPLAALYWLLPDVRLLLGAQALITAVGAVPLYLIGRGRGLPWLGVAAGLAYLLHPSVQNMALFDFHVDTLAATAFLFAIWGVDARRPWVTLGAALVVMACKENFAVATAFLGLLLVMLPVGAYSSATTDDRRPTTDGQGSPGSGMVARGVIAALLDRRQWRLGLALMVLSAAWFLAATQVLVPSLVAKDQSIHVARFAKYGDSVPAILLTILTRPQLILGDLITPAAPGYLAQLLLPLALLPLLSPYALLAAPTVAINLLSIIDAQQTVYFHYSALAVAALAGAALHGACRVTQAFGRGRARQAAAWLLGALLLAAAVRGQGLSELRRDAIADAAERDSPVPLYYAYLASLVPPDAGVSTSGPLQPHLTHRQQAYMFPNPFVEAAFFNPQAMPFAPRVDYIIYDTRRFDRIGAQPEVKQATLDELRSSGLYVEVGRLEGIILLRAADEHRRGGPKGLRPSEKKIMHTIKPGLISLVEERAQRVVVDPWALDHREVAAALDPDQAAIVDEAGDLGGAWRGHDLVLAGPDNQSGTVDYGEGLVDRLGAGAGRRLESGTLVHLQEIGGGLAQQHVVVGQAVEEAGADGAVEKGLAGHPRAAQGHPQGQDIMDACDKATLALVAVRAHAGQHEAAHTTGVADGDVDGDAGTERVAVEVELIETEGVGEGDYDLGNMVGASGAGERR